MSSATLPEFRKGEPLTAAALNALGSRIRSLQLRAAAAGGLGHGRQRVLPGRCFAFQLAELNGCVWCRQGWLEVGGSLVQVGDREWNLVGGMRPCTVWLEVTRADDGAVSGAVVQGELDLVSPESNLRRRLGYVRQEEGEDGSVGVWHAVQVLGGVVSPVVPRRQMGTANAEYPGGLRKSDAGLLYLHAGNIVGPGYSVDEHEVPGQRVSLGFYNQLQEVVFPAAHGGRRLVQVMGLG